MESLEIDWEVDSSRPIDNTDRDRVVRRDIPLGLALKFRIEAKVSFILIYAVLKNEAKHLTNLLHCPFWGP